MKLEEILKKVYIDGQISGAKSTARPNFENIQEAISQIRQWVLEQIPEEIKSPDSIGALMPVEDYERLHDYNACRREMIDKIKEAL